MHNNATLVQLLLSILCCCSLVFLLLSAFFHYTKKIDTNVHIVICDVGQGDAILIYQGFYQILIDSSRDAAVLACLQQHVPIWDQTIELTIITHFDSDHSGGLAALASRYSLPRIYAPLRPLDGSRGDGQVSPQNATELLSNLHFNEPFLGQSVSFSSGLTVSFYSPRLLYQAKQAITPGYQIPTLTTNDTSLVTLLEFGELSFLAVGDLEKTGESVLTTFIKFGSIDILKVGHHGAKTSSTMQFLQAITPSVAVISVGTNNSYGHPSQEVLKRLGQVGARVLRTDVDGTIEIVSDGSQWWLDSLK
jgi:competence protein ComEC